MGTYTTVQKFYLPTEGFEPDTWGDSADDGVDGPDTGLPKSVNGNMRRLDVLLTTFGATANGALPKAGGAITGAITKGAGGSIGSNLLPLPIEAESINIRTPGGPVVASWAASGILTAVNVVATSDAGMKRNVADLSDEALLAAVLQMQPVSFQWKHAPGPEHCGVIAQAVQAIEPRLVARQPGSPLAVDTLGLVSHLIGAVKALSRHVDTLTEQVHTLQAEVGLLRDMAHTHRDTGLDKSKKHKG